MIMVVLQVCDKSSFVFCATLDLIDIGDTESSYITETIINSFCFTLISSLLFN